jgi:hypothetical protein
MRYNIDSLTEETELTDNDMVEVTKQQTLDTKANDIMKQFEMIYDVGRANGLFAEIHTGNTDGSIHFTFSKTNKYIL